MKNIVIFEDGKTSRGQRAKLIKRGNKRVLIEFTDYDYNLKKDVVKTEWFKIFIPPWGKSKHLLKRNNKRKFASFCHNESNMFFSDYRQTDSFKNEMKEHFSDEYWIELFSN